MEEAKIIIVEQIIIRAEEGIDMNWEEAIRLFVDYEATVLSDGKGKTALEKAQGMERDIKYLLSQMPNFASKSIEDITPEVWIT